MSDFIRLHSILQDPTLSWDPRCFRDFTFFGHCIHDPYGFNYPAPSKQIEKLDQKIIELYQSCGLAVKKMLNIQDELNNLYKNPVLDIEKRDEYLKNVGGLRAQLPEAMQDARNEMTSLACELTPEKRKKYYKKLTEEEGIRFSKPFGREIRGSQKELYDAVAECGVLLKSKIQKYSSNIPKELYIELVTLDLNAWKESLDKIYCPKTSDIDRQECFSQLTVRKDFLGSALAEILKKTDAQKELIHESWKDAPNILDRDFSRAKFYADSRDKNLAELDELIQCNSHIYRDRSLLYAQKLIDQELHLDAINHMTQWMKSLPPNTPIEDVLQMADLYMQANILNFDSPEFLNALNQWTNDHSELHIDPEGYLPLRREAEQIAITKGSLYSNTDQKLSFAAAEYYQIWRMARPNDLTPKVLLAFFYISNIDWNKSEQIIAELPEEYSILMSKNRMAHMFGLITSDLTIWKELLDKIYCPQTSDTDRQEHFAQLKAKKNSLAFTLIRILKETDTQKEDIHKSWEDMPDILDRDFSRAKFYADSRDENLAELGDLIQGNPPIYRDRCLLYGQKLVDQGLHRDAINHTTQWMKSLPRDTPWEDVLQMAGLYIQANILGSDSTEFLNAFNQWTKDQPDLHVDPEGYLPLRREAEQIAITKGALYANTNQKLNFAAAGCYQVWRMARPNDLTPKILLASFHISNAEWEKSKQIIAELPEEYSVPMSNNRLAHMFRVYSLSAEAASMLILRSAIPFIRRKILPGSMRDQALDVLSSTVQGASHQAFRRYWMPYCAEDLCLLSEEPLSFMDKTSLGILTAQIVLPFVLPPIFEFFVPNLETRMTYLQPVLEFCSPVLGIGMGGALVYNAYETASSLVMPATMLTSSTVSLVGRAILRYNKEMNPTSRAMIATAVKISSIVQDIGFAYVNESAIASVTSHIANYCGAQVFYSNLGNFLASIPTVNGIPALIVASAVATAVYGVFFDFPRARTGAVLEEASRLCHRKKYVEAKNLLKTAEEWEWIWSDRPVIQKYIGCIPFLESVPNVRNREDHRQWIQETLPFVNEAIEILENSEYYSSVKDDLQYQEVVTYLNAEQMEPAKTFLNSISQSSSVHGNVILFVIEKAKKINNYLNRVKTVFQIPEYQEIITKYQEYLDCQNRYPVPSENGADISVGEWDRIISSLLDLVRPRKILGQLIENLLFDALVLHINTGNSKKAEELLNQTTSTTHEQLVLILIGQTIDFFTKNDLDAALRCLDRGIALDKFSHQPLLKSFRVYMELQKAQPVLTKDSSPGEIYQRVAVLDAISQSTVKIEISPFVRREKLFLYIQAEKFQETAECIEEHSIDFDLQDVAILKIIQHAENLSENEAFSYLTKAHEPLATLPHSFAVIQYRNLKILDRNKFTSDEGGVQWTVAAQTLLEKLKPIPGLSPLYLSLEGEMAVMRAHKKEYREAMQIIRQDVCPAIAKTKMLLHILYQAMSLPPEESRVYLQTAFDGLDGCEHREILKEIQNCLPNDPERFTSAQASVKWAMAADALIARIKPLTGLISLHMFMSGFRYLLHIHLKEYTAATGVAAEMKLPEKLQTDSLMLIIHRADEMAKQNNAPQEIHLYLEDAYKNLLGFKYREILQLYKDCLPLREVSPEEDIRWATAADKFIAAVKSLPELSSLYSMMQASKCMFHIASKEFIKVADILKEGVLKNEFQLSLLNYVARQAYELSRKGENQKALMYLKEAYEELKELVPGNIFLTLREYLACEKDCRSSDWVKASEVLIADLRLIPQLLDLMLEVRCKQFEVFLNQDKFYDIKHVLEQAEIPSKLRTRLQDLLIAHFVTFSLKLKEFEQITRLLGISKHKLAREYVAVCASLERNFPEVSSTLKAEESLQLLNALSNSLKTLALPLPNWIASMRANLYCVTGQFYWKTNDFRSSQEAFSNAETLLVMQNPSENQGKLTHIRNFKEKISALMART